MMRTTVTLDPDTVQLVRQRMADRQVSFKQALNDAIRDGALAGATKQQEFHTATSRMGKPKVDLDKALRLAGSLEDADLHDKLLRMS